MLDWMKQQENESDWDWLCDMASLALTIFFVALACVAFLTVWAVLK